MKQCTNPKVGRLLTAYHNGEVLTPQGRSKFEKHMLVCDSCWKALKKLDREKNRESEEP